MLIPQAIIIFLNSSATEWSSDNHIEPRLYCTGDFIVVISIGGDENLNSQNGLILDFINSKITGQVILLCFNPLLDEITRRINFFYYNPLGTLKDSALYNMQEHQPHETPHTLSCRPRGNLRRCWLQNANCRVALRIS